MEQRVEAASAGLLVSSASSRSWSEPLAFIIMVAVLAFRPQGIMGRAA